ncbi:hypothetical protein [Janthinobacterium sp. LB2P70]|uniref:hypothetical protein n=1 Tax=Janthinobacterium sp. LB2P70 TaxID=3424197 RepID=UPI003F21E58F
MDVNKKPRKRHISKPAVLPSGTHRAMAFEMPDFQSSKVMGKAYFLGRRETTIFRNKFIDVNCAEAIIDKESDACIDNIIKFG